MGEECSGKSEGNSPPGSVEVDGRIILKVGVTEI
jgi:hypothetical protein